MKESLKILVLEDQPDDVGLIERVLKKGGIQFSIRQVDSRQEFVDSIDNFAPDIILSDHALPQFNSIEALKICKAHRRRIPFILVTGTVSEEFAVNCLKHGADDYVLKSNLARLPAAILTSIKRHEMEFEKKRAEEHLFKQNAELSKINKELDSFVYNISHNLRAPLASLLGLLHLAKRENGLSGSLQELFGMMLHAIQKLDATLAEILNYSQNNRNKVKGVHIDFKKLVDTCFRALNYLPGYGEIEKTIGINGASTFHSDPQRLSVLFRNLISNSLRYRDPGKARQVIIVSVTITQSNATIRFEDNGIGIDEALLPNVFDMFFRATEKSDGAGLGLYVVKEIVHVLKGKLSIQSRLHEGTILSIRLPNLDPGMIDG